MNKFNTSISTAEHIRSNHKIDWSRTQKKIMRIIITNINDFGDIKTHNELSHKFVCKHSLKKIYFNMKYLKSEKNKNNLKLFFTLRVLKALSLNYYNNNNVYQHELAEEIERRGGNIKRINRYNIIRKSKV